MIELVYWFSAKDFYLNKEIKEIQFGYKIVLNYVLIITKILNIFHKNNFNID